MKKALIIVYDGKTPPVQAQKNAAEILAQYGLINSLEKIDIYTLDEADIVTAMVEKAMTGGKKEFVEFEKPEEWAAKIIIDMFKESLLDKAGDTFGIVLSLKLSSDVFGNTDSDFMKAMRILTQEHAEDNITDKQRKYLDDKAFQVMRQVFYLVCQKQSIVFR